VLETETAVEVRVVDAILYDGVEIEELRLERRELPG